MTGPVKLYSSGNLISSGTDFSGSFGEAYCLYVSSGGSVSAAVSSGGQIHVSSGGKAASSTVLTGGSMTVYRGGSAANTMIAANGGLVISSGGNAAGTIVSSGGSMIVSNGGLADNTVVSSRGNFYVSSGGSAISTLISGGNGWFYDDAYISSAAVVSGNIHLFGAAAVSFLSAYSTGSARVASGAIVKSAVSLSGGIISVENSGTVSALKISSGGAATIWSGGIVKDLVISSGGSMNLKFGGTLHGTITLQSGSILQTDARAGIQMLLSERTASDPYLINDISYISGNPAYTISVSSTQAYGEYRLVQNAASFSKTITVKCGSEELGSLNINGSGIFSSNRLYSLKKVDNSLHLLVSTAEIGDLQADFSGASWRELPNITAYEVELSPDDFSHVLQLTVSGNALDFYNLPVSCRWRVKIEGTDWVEGSRITAAPETAPKVWSSDADGSKDLFFAHSNGVWTGNYAAEHQGRFNGWSGTGQQVMLTGKNRISDIFTGAAADDNLLLLTDDANGDALILDDIFSPVAPTAAAVQARFSRIREIRAGAGEDVIDLTSNRIAYTGNGLKIYGGGGNDTIWANNGTNILCGGAGNDSITGAFGDDIISGGAGNDTLHGGGGEDVFVFGENWGIDTVTQLATGSITLWFESGSRSNWDAGTMTYTCGSSKVTVSGTDRILLKFGDDNSFQFDNLTAVGAFEDDAAGRIFGSTAEESLLA